MDSEKIMALTVKNELFQGINKNPIIDIWFLQVRP